MSFRSRGNETMARADMMLSVARLLLGMREPSYVTDLGHERRPVHPTDPVELLNRSIAAMLVAVVMVVAGCEGLGGGSDALPADWLDPPAWIATNLGCSWCKPVWLAAATMGWRVSWR